jgi:hypothetical protein
MPDSKLKPTKTTHSVFTQRLIDATRAVFGDRSLTHAVEDACIKYQRDIENIQTGRGINALTLAIVGAKGQGKTWVARQLIRDNHVRVSLRSGDLLDDATTRLVWIGPHAPDGLDSRNEIYIPCQAANMVEIGQPFVLLDTPGITDTHQRAAEIANDALSLAPIKLLVIARDQLRAAANIQIATRIDGAVCIPVISSVEPEEIRDGTQAAAELRSDLRALRDQLHLRAPAARLVPEVLVPDFEITADEEASAQSFVSQLIDRLSELQLGEMSLANTRETRMQSAQSRLRNDVARLIGNELPQLSAAVERLNHETSQLPERVLASLLGSSSVLETGVRMRLRARLVSDTALVWFPYRTVMSTLNLTQGAWDRVILALAGSVPSLFGALSSWARNARQNREFSLEIQEGIRQRTQRQVEERLKPLCDQFHRAVMKLRAKEERSSAHESSSHGMSLSGIDELQNRSQRIFDDAIARNATGWLSVQLMAIMGTILFWSFMAGPIVLIYREYFSASLHALNGTETRLENFPHPTPSLLITSVVLSVLPLAVFCMVVMTGTLSRRKVSRVAREIINAHETTIDDLKKNDVIRLEFEDELLQQVELLLNLRRVLENV